MSAAADKLFWLSAAVNSLKSIDSGFVFQAFLRRGPERSRRVPRRHFEDKRSHCSHFEGERCGSEAQARKASIWALFSQLFCDLAQKDFFEVTSKVLPKPPKSLRRTRSHFERGRSESRLRKHRFGLCFSSFSAPWPARVSLKSLRECRCHSKGNRSHFEDPEATPKAPDVLPKLRKASIWALFSSFSAT